MSRCRETAGVLFKKQCHFPSTQKCGACNKPICRMHVRQFSEREVCIACARTELQREPSSRGSYSHLRDDPYFYWYYSDSSWFHDPYGEEDYALFDTGVEEGDFAAGVEDQWEGT